MRQLGSWLCPQLAKLSPGTEQLVWDTFRGITTTCLSVREAKPLVSCNPVSALEQLLGNLLTGNKEETWQCMVNSGKGATMDIVLNNLRFELFTEFLVNIGKTAKVRMRDQTWYVSDTTPQVITLTLNQLPRGVDNTEPVMILVERLSSYLSLVCGVCRRTASQPSPAPSP